jgi:hypothetical protein
MMGVNGVNHSLSLFIPAGYIHADIYVRTLNLVVKSLTDIMEQTGPAGDGGI